MKNNINNISGGETSQVLFEEVEASGLRTVRSAERWS
jgi:hypothetical protein